MPGASTLLYGVICHGNQSQKVSDTFCWRITFRGTPAEGQDPVSPGPWREGARVTNAQGPGIFRGPAGPRSSAMNL